MGPKLVGVLVVAWLASCGETVARSAHGLRARSRVHSEPAGLMCPILAPKDVGMCLYECQDDSECPGMKLCCANGCGNVCMDPIVDDALIETLYNSIGVPRDAASEHIAAEDKQEDKVVKKSKATSQEKKLTVDSNPQPHWSGGQKEYVDGASEVVGARQAYSNINENEQDVLNKVLVPHLPHLPQAQHLVQDRAQVDSLEAPGEVTEKEAGGLDRVVFTLIVTACSVAAIIGAAAAGACWYRLQKSAKQAADTEYPAYGVTGPNNNKMERSGSAGDRKLAQSAQMYHYQHQKQQMIAMEKASSELKAGEDSQCESEDDNEEGDYTVYECPGLASTGEMTVKNPLFAGEETPIAQPGGAAPQQEEEEEEEDTTHDTTRDPPPPSRD